MSVDERLRHAAAGLPEPHVDLPAVLAETMRSGRRRRLVARVHTGVIAAVVLAAIVVLPMAGDSPPAEDKIADRPPREKTELVSPRPLNDDDREVGAGLPVPQPGSRLPIAATPAPAPAQALPVLPSGQRLAFTRNEAYAFTWRNVIYVAGADGAAPARVLRSRSDESEPSWSPDGRHVVFVERPIRNNEFTGEVFLSVATPSTSSVRVLKRSTSTHPVLNPAWSSDGSRIVFVEQTCNTGDCAGAIGVSASSIKSIKPDGSSEIEHLSSGGVSTTTTSYWTPSWSPDGRRIVFARATGDSWAVLIKDVYGTWMTTIASGYSYAFDTAWSPDGRHIALSTANAVGAQMITVMNADGSAQKVVSNGADPAWSADGRIGFVKDHVIHTIDRNGGSLQQLTDGVAPAFG